MGESGKDVETRTMKRFPIIIALSMLTIILTGCGAFYGVSKDSPILSLPYTSHSTDIETGTASIFVGGTNNLYDKFSRFFTDPQSEIGFYEDNAYIYFKNVAMYGINRKITLAKSAQGGVTKIAVGNIQCNNGTCIITGTRSKLVVSAKKGYAGDLDFEYVDLSKRVAFVQSALDTYENLSLHNDYLPTTLISQQRVESSIDKAVSVEQLGVVANIIDALQYDSVKAPLVKKMDYLSFTEEYANIINAPLTEQVSFLRKYASASNQPYCYEVVANELNIRQSPSVGAAKIGTYKKGQEVCAVAFKGNWAKTNKGFVSREFISNKMVNDFAPEFMNIHQIVETKTFDNANAQYSVTAYSEYLAQYPNGKYTVQATQNIAQLAQIQESLAVASASKEKADFKLLPIAPKKHPNESNIIKCAALVWGADACGTLAQEAAAKGDRALFDVAVSPACAKAINEGFTAAPKQENFEFSLYTDVADKRDEREFDVGILSNSRMGLLSRTVDINPQILRFRKCSDKTQ